MWDQLFKDTKKDLKDIHRRQGEIYDTINDIKYMLKQQELKGYSLDRWTAERLK